MFKEKELKEIDQVGYMTKVVSIGLFVVRLE